VRVFNSLPLGVEADGVEVRGEFSLFGQSFTMSSFLKNTDVARIDFFHMKKFFFFRIPYGRFFSQTPLLTSRN
jgi:hypothetical protein